MPKQKSKRTAVWALTPNGRRMALKIAPSLSRAELYLSAGLDPQTEAGPESDQGAGISTIRFERLADAVGEKFNAYDGHIFIMSTGIVVRMIAAHMRHKRIDPAVVVMDERGNHVISLLSGHIGGGNRLAEQVAAVIGAIPVITTATDVNAVPAVDLLATERGLFIENPSAIKTVSMALLKGEKLGLYDPFGLLCGAIPQNSLLPSGTDFQGTANAKPEDTWSHPVFTDGITGVFVDDRVVDLPPEVLVLRPRSLAAGIGCNRNTPQREIQELLFQVLKRFGLSKNSLARVGTVDLKADEPGLLNLAEALDIPLQFFGKVELKRVDGIENPSAVVEKHIGVKSVCEASAILAAKMGELIVPKQSTKNVTVAIARERFTL